MDGYAVSMALVHDICQPERVLVTERIGVQQDQAELGLIVSGASGKVAHPSRARENWLRDRP
jgi:hypothetical protein